MINVDYFVNKAKELYKLKTSYKLGTFLNKKIDGKYFCDCSGLIKAIFWGYPTNGKYAGSKFPDINANTMIKNCTKTSTDFSKIKTGAIVWLSGHVGIYIGNGVVLECTPKWKGGIQKSYCIGSPFTNTNKLKKRKWTKWGLFKYVNYTEKTKEYYKKSNYKGSSLVDGLKNINVDSSLSNRKKIAVANGIKNYTGTSTQNIILLNKLKKGMLIKA